MGIVYSDTDTAPTGRYPVPYDRLDATKHYLTHYGNWKYLSFILQNSQDRMERHQANTEILIADRKMAYWLRHPNLNRTLLEEGKRKLDQDWSKTP
jgi:hypothetical protein